MQLEFRNDKKESWEKALNSKLGFLKCEHQHLRIHELKWTGMGEFNSDEHYIHYCGQESLRRNRAALIENKSLKCSTWMQSQK